MPASCIAWAYSADMIEAKSMASIARNGAAGCLSTNLTVCSSTASTACRSSGMPVLTKYSYEPPETLW